MESNFINQDNLIGDRIKSLRLGKGWTQKDLANKLGLKNDTAIANYESGYSIPKDSMKLKLCRVFNCSLDYLMRTEEYQKKMELKDKYYNDIFELIHNKYPTILSNYINDESSIEEALSIPLSFLSSDYETILDVKKVSNEVNKKRINFLSKFDSETAKKINLIFSNIYKDAQDFLNAKDEEDKATMEKSISKLETLLSNHNIPNLKLIPVLGKIAAGQPILAEEYLEGYLPVDPNIYGMSTSDDLFYLKVSGESMNLKVRNGDYALIQKQDYAENGDIVVAIVNGDDEATLKKYKKLNDQFILLEPMSSDSSIEAITVDLKDTSFKIIGKAIGQFGKF